MATAVLQTLRTRLLTASISTALAVGLMVSATGAEARISDAQRSVYEHGPICGFIQDMYDAAYATWSVTSLVGPDSDASWADMMYWRQQWGALGCDGLFGSLGRLAPRITNGASANITSANITAGTTPKQGSR